MKKILTMAIAIILTAGFTASAADNGCNKPNTQKVGYQLSFAKLVVSDDIDIVIKESNEKAIEFSGADGSIEKVDWKISKGVLHISSKKGSLKGKVKICVYVSSSQLKEIAVKGDSDVRSAGFLNAHSLKITIDGNSFIAIKNNGTIHVVNEDGVELDVRKAIGDVTIG